MRNGWPDASKPNTTHKRRFKRCAILLSLVTILIPLFFPTFNREGICFSFNPAVPRLRSGHRPIVVGASCSSPSLPSFKWLALAPPTLKRATAEAAASGQRPFSWFSGISWLSVFLQSQSGIQIRKFQTERSSVPLRKSSVFYGIIVAKILFPIQESGSRNSHDFRYESRNLTIFLGGLRVLRADPAYRIKRA